MFEASGAVDESLLHRQRNMEKILSSKQGDCDTVEFEIRNGVVVPTLSMTVKPTPKGVGFVDQLSFTFLDDFHRNQPLRKRVAECGGGSVYFDDSQIVTEAVAAFLRDVFGLGVGVKRPAGLNFYRDTWTLLDSSGMVSIGGQQNTILVQITGHGMAKARAGWEQRLHAWSELMTRFVITRLDLAYDDADGQRYSVDRALDDYDAGNFSMGGRPPSCEQRGNWRRFDGLGRSFYVGRRENGKMLRVYEKGRQLGDSASEWVRIELELHNKDRFIPFDAILRPGAYLAGAYTAVEFVSHGEPHSKIATSQKIVKMTYDAFLRHFSRSYGGLLGVILSVEESALNLLADLAKGRPMPRRLDLALSALDPAG
jgi:phage replication initiation protein